MSPAEIDSLPLHDAVLESIDISWEKAECTLRLSVFLKRDKRAEPCRLQFFGVTRLLMPKNQPWGPSVSVNGAKLENGTVQIEMQSGDTIEVVATGIEFGTL
jgi:hypothetical protein